MIYIFGDSFSVKFGDRRFVSNIQNYIKWKGYEPKLYYELLCEEYSDDFTCYVKPGVSNHYIFHQFIKNFHNINTNDIVIFNWTEINRFIYYENNEIRSSLSIDYNNVFSKQTFDEIILNRKNKNYIIEQYDFINFINKILENNKVIHWTWSSNTEIPQKNEFTIIKETNGLIEDYHFGETGHIYLYQNFSKKLKENNKINFNLWNINSNE